MWHARTGQRKWRFDGSTHFLVNCLGLDSFGGKIAWMNCSKSIYSFKKDSDLEKNM